MKNINLLYVYCKPFGFYLVHISILKRLPGSTFYIRDLQPSTFLGWLLTFRKWLELPVQCELVNCENYKSLIIKYQNHIRITDVAHRSQSPPGYLKTSCSGGRAGWAGNRQASYCANTNKEPLHYRKKAKCDLMDIFSTGDTSKSGDRIKWLIQHEEFELKSLRFTGEECSVRVWPDLELGAVWRWCVSWAGCAAVYCRNSGAPPIHSHSCVVMKNYKYLFGNRCTKVDRGKWYTLET